MVGYNSDGPARDRVLRLMAEKDRIESEIREQNDVLAANNIGMHDPLVDAEGYPRGDIDVYKVRHARHRIICLQNDHKALMRRIDQGLNEVHSQFRADQGSSSVSVSQTNGHMTNGHMINGHMANGHVGNGHGSVNDEVFHVSQNEQGFATITFVHDGSPADLAGLCVDDEVLQFGSINPQNFSDITQVHDVVSHSVGQGIRVLVRRDNHIVNLTVTPRPWSNPGLLGCQIVRRAN